MGGEEKPTFMQKVRTNWAAFRIFLWNSEKREFLGRNSKSWGQIGIFYLIYYICLALFWALMLVIFMQTISPDHPTFNSYVSVPGLRFRPKFSNKIVRFNPDVPRSYKAYVDELQNIWDSLSPGNQTGDQYVQCSNDTAPEEGKYCTFDREVFGPCRPPHFGWDTGMPCLFLSMNRVGGWIPEDYEEGSVPDVVKDVYTPGYIAIHCMNYKNKNMHTNNTIYPSEGIPSEFFPFIISTNETKRADYVQPYVAVQFEFNVEDEKAKVHCQAYCANINPKGGLFDTKEKSEVTYEFVLSSDKDEF